ncbi:MAG: hypothetical protein A3E82_01110 [Gammaproteobacteria bacterium RIFCSPHIGHO2_12_FULL_38_11]|nr:MAG: hypothetical protein A3E82_01110 [Gammaproteobacteria bacterium RIFCSPHIGHO2_12_FULL_38_11]
MLPLKKQADFVMPDKRETDLASESSRILASSMTSKKNAPVMHIAVNGKEKTVIVPLSAFKLLIDILTQMAEGNAVTVTAVNAELTTQEAADLLNVSRPYLVGLLDDKKIPYRKVGTRRKVLAKDILAYKKNIDEQRMKTLDELAKESQDLNLGY